LVTLVLLGQVIAGAKTSTTVTVKLQLADRPNISTTRNVCVVTPAGNTDPLGRPLVCVVTGVVHACRPTGVPKVTVALHKVTDVFTTMFAGQAMVGRFPSSTGTLKLHEP